MVVVVLNKSEIFAILVQSKIFIEKSDPNPVDLSNRDEHGSGLKPILAGSGLDRTASFFQLADQDWIGVRKFVVLKCLF